MTGRKRLGPLGANAKRVKWSSIEIVLKEPIPEPEPKAPKRKAKTKRKKAKPKPKVKKRKKVVRKRKPTRKRKRKPAKVNVRLSKEERSRIQREAWERWAGIGTEDEFKEALEAAREVLSANSMNDYLMEPSNALDYENAFRRATIDKYRG